MASILDTIWMREEDYAPSASNLTHYLTPNKGQKKLQNVGGSSWFSMYAVLYEISNQPNISKLDVSCNQLSFKNDKILVEMWSALFGNVTDIDLGQNLLCEKNPIVVAAMLTKIQQQVRLRRLSLNYNYLGTKPGAIQTVIAACGNDLQELSLQGNCLDQLSTTEFMRLANSAVGILDLSANNLASRKDLPEFFANLHRNIHTLNISANKFGYAPVAILCAALKTMSPYIKTLDISYNLFAHYTDAELVQLALAIPNTVEELIFKNNEIALCDMRDRYDSNYALVPVDFKPENSIERFELFVSSLHSGLRKLDLSYCGIEANAIVNRTYNYVDIIAILKLLQALNRFDHVILDENSLIHTYLQNNLAERLLLSVFMFRQLPKGLRVLNWKTFNFGSYDLETLKLILANIHNYIEVYDFSYLSLGMCTSSLEIEHVCKLLAVTRPGVNTLILTNCKLGLYPAEFNKLKRIVAAVPNTISSLDLSYNYLRLDKVDDFLAVIESISLIKATLNELNLDGNFNKPVPIDNFVALLTAIKQHTNLCKVIFADNLLDAQGWDQQDLRILANEFPEFVTTAPNQRLHLVSDWRPSREVKARLLQLTC